MILPAVLLAALSLQGVPLEGGDARLISATVEPHWGESRLQIEVRWHFEARFPDGAPQRVAVRQVGRLRDALLLEDVTPALQAGVWRASAMGQPLAVKQRHWLGAPGAAKHEFEVIATFPDGREQRIRREFEFGYDARWALLDQLEKTRRPPALRVLPSGTGLYGFDLGMRRSDLPDSEEELVCSTLEIREICNTTLPIAGVDGPFVGAWLPARLAFRQGRLCGAVLAAPASDLTDVRARIEAVHGPARDGEGKFHWGFGNAVIELGPAPRANGWSRLRYWNEACVVSPRAEFDGFPNLPMDVLRGRP
jgi:hypothetical protein